MIPPVDQYWILHKTRDQVLKVEKQSFALSNIQKKIILQSGWNGLLTLTTHGLPSGWDAADEKSIAFWN